MPGVTTNSSFYNTMQYDQLYNYVHEDYIPSDNLWFVTFTLSPKCFRYNAITQFDMTVNELRSILNEWTRQYTLTVELTEQGNVHYHAICKIVSKIHRIRIIEKCKSKRVLGFVKINSLPITTSEMLQRSCNYIIKELDKTRLIISRGGYYPDLLFIKNV